MKSSKNSVDPENVDPNARESNDESEDEDESEVLEESPCGRWQKRREPVGSSPIIILPQHQKLMTVEYKICFPKFYQYHTISYHTIPASHNLPVIIFF